MIRHSLRTKETTIVREPASTRESQDALIERKTGVVDGVPIPADEWSRIVIDQLELADIIKRDRETR